MNENPLQRHIKGLGMTASQLAWRGSLSHAAVSMVFNAKQPMTPNLAQRFSGSVRFDKFTLLVANALWRKAENIELSDSETTFIGAAEKVSGGYSEEELTMALNSGLYFLDCLLNPVPPAPPIILAKQKGGK